ncbi:nucleoside triphosphate pyrophosphatase [Methylosinus sp. Ce-a6]|uniref:Maf family protein n=1 Tax=Methylosinus sp. Ce-a6 TaxID=2172005 RepID=UPI0013589C86|nr:Maf family protein [Methylosinus sp. Ce-a6]
MSSHRDGVLWLHPQPLILASKSKGRRAALEQTRLPFLICPAEIDERAVEAEVVAAGGDADAVAARLARDKASAVSLARPGALTLGADQVASCEERRFGKPATTAAASEQLRFLSGRAHRLHSAVALARDGEVIFETVACAELTMRSFSDDFLARYLEIIGEEATASAGAYQIEGLGVHLFERIVGDHWTIIGMPLLPVLDALRREGALLS